MCVVFMDVQETDKMKSDMPFLYVFIPVSQLFLNKMSNPLEDSVMFYWETV